MASSLSELTFEFWINIGKELQLSGQELMNFADTKFKERLSIENKRIEREERKEKEKREREDRLLDRNSRKEEEDRKLEYERLELENKKLSSLHSVSPQSINAQDSFSVAIPKLKLYESGEDITAYLIRFENLAKLSGWPKELWAPRLALLFSGDALNVYSTLPDEVCKDYDKLKDAILKAFRKTTEQYRREFRYAKFKDENFMQYLTNLYRLFDFWIDSAKIDKNYDSLRDFIVTDQFMSAIPKYIRLFLMEQGFTNATELARKADLYCGAHDCYPNRTRDKNSNKSSSKKVQIEQKPETKATFIQTKDKIQMKNPICFTCGDRGHYAKNCPKSPKAEEVIKRCLTGNDRNLGPFCAGKVNGLNVSTILRDTGCTCIMVSDKIFPNIQPDKLPKCTVSDYLGRKNDFPVTRAFLDCQFFKGWTDVVVAPIDCCSVMIGNVEGATMPDSKDTFHAVREKFDSVSVVTRSKSSKES
ncbi:uncharacterized protein LOC135226265 [Macrobrachium nipponense]|uniref:uncharacterized protein LOC135226265 n=1 Tax=Macrobrachium nipponense TaxID=159736 RepID=UPI0030C801FA